MKNDYNHNRYNRKKNKYRLLLGIRQMILHPLMLLLIIPIVALTVFIWLNMDYAYMFQLPQMLQNVYNYVPKTLGVILPLLLMWGLMDLIGTLFARRDEANLQLVFSEEETNGFLPILISKKKDRVTGIIVREWYTVIPKGVWEKHMNDIADVMNVHFIGGISYGGKANGNRIVMRTAVGREPVERNQPFYDQDLENDMKRYKP